MIAFVPFKLLAWIVFAWWFSASSVVAQISPVQVDRAALESEPEMYAGLVQVEYANRYSLGSGVIVGEGTIATAAHLVFDSDELRWSTQLHFSPGHHERYNHRSFRQSAYLFGTILREASYQSRVERDLKRPLDAHLSSYDTFNLDIAAASTLASSGRISGGRYPETNVDPEAPGSLLRMPFTKTILGYPGDEAIPEINRGFMHGIAPGNYTFGWPLLDEDSYRDSGGFWAALYFTDGIISYAGSSGGPVFVWDPDFKRWVFSAVVVGGGRRGSLVRAIDGLAWDLIATAARATGTHRLERIEWFFAVEREGGLGVLLEWTDTSPAAAGVAILRQAGTEWEVLARVPVDQHKYLDTSIEEGMQYTYAVQPFDFLGNTAPRSPVAKVATQGSNPAFASAVGAPYLAWSTGGSVAFVSDKEGLRSGRVPSLGNSYIMATVTGPGTLTFEWSASSEENKEFDNRGSNVHGLIYDAFYFSIDGIEDEWISGQIGRHAVQKTLSAGHHTLRWEYRKDPYTDHHEDAGFLHTVTWEEASGSVIYGGFDVGGGYFWAHWWGYYTPHMEGWSYHLELGWLYQVSSDGFWSYSLIPGVEWFYTAAGTYPFIYSVNNGWLYYFRESGLGGENAYVHDYGTGVNRKLRE